MVTKPRTKDYAAGIYEDTRYHRFFFKNREIRLGIVPTQPFYLNPTRFRILEVLWESQDKNKLLALMTDDRNANVRYRTIIDPENLIDMSKIPPAYFYCFVQFKLSSNKKELEAELLACDYCTIETIKLDGYIDDGYYYFEICLDDCPEEHAAYTGIMYPDYFKKSFLGEIENERYMLLANYNVDRGEHVSSIINSRGVLININTDWDDERWSSERTMIEHTFKMEPNDMRWQILGRPVICDDGDRIRMALVEAELGNITVEVEINKATFLSGGKWRIKNLFLIFSGTESSPYLGAS